MSGPGRGGGVSQTALDLVDSRARYAAGGYLTLRSDFALNPSMAVGALTAGIQSAITSAISAGKGLDVGAEMWPINAPLVIAGSLAVRGAGVSEVGTNGYTPGAAPWVRGGGFIQQSAGVHILDLTPASGYTSVNLKDLGLMFGGSSAFNNTGDAINSSPVAQRGLQMCQWSNLVIFGHDGNHYAVNVNDFGFINADLIRTYGGGGWRMHNTSAAFAGNSVITNPYTVVCVRGTADGFKVDSSGPSPGGVVLTTFVRPQTQVVTAVGSSMGIAFGITLAPDLAVQYAYRDIGTQTQYVLLIAPDWEPTVAKVAMTVGTTVIGPEISYRPENNVNLGYGALPGVPVPSQGQNNTAIGYQALGVIDTTASGNTAVGYRALKAATGSGNAALGGNALLANTTGANNTAVGTNTLVANTTGGTNTAIGASALAANTTGINNVAIGGSALATNTTVNSQVAVGDSALQFNTTGTLNTAVGAAALMANTSGAASAALGNQALTANTTGAFNAAVGVSALLANTSGSFNVAVGGSALAAMLTQTENSAIGYAALAAATGNGNTAVGSQAGRSVVAGTNTLSMGYRAGYTDGTNVTTDNNSMTMIGELAQATTANVIVLGKAIATRPNMIFGGIGAAAAFGGGVGVFAIANAATIPATNPTGGPIIYAEGGALKCRGTAGTVTVLAAA